MRSCSTCSLRSWLCALVGTTGRRGKSKVWSSKCLHQCPSCSCDHLAPAYKRVLRRVEAPALRRHASARTRTARAGAVLHNTTDFRSLRGSNFARHSSFLPPRPSSCRAHPPVEHACQRAGAAPMPHPPHKREQRARTNDGRRKNERNDYRRRLLAAAHAREPCAQPTRTSAPLPIEHPHFCCSPPSCKPCLRGLRAVPAHSVARQSNAG